MNVAVDSKLLARLLYFVKEGAGLGTADVTFRSAAVKLDSDMRHELGHVYRTLWLKIQEAGKP